MQTGGIWPGLLLVRRDGRVVAVEDAKLDDWLDLDAQLDEEPVMGLLEEAP